MGSPRALGCTIAQDAPEHRYCGLRTHAVALRRASHSVLTEWALTLVRWLHRHLLYL